MTFAVDLERFAKRAGRSLDETRRAVCIELFNGVVKRSPVDSGRFRGNWQTSVAAPKLNAIDRTDYAPLGSRAGASVQAEIDSNLGALGEVVYFANNLPYAERLETGYSGQAPGGMVRVTVAEFQRIVETEARKNRV